jgi:S1-C subfamily serine protease
LLCFTFLTLLLFPFFLALCALIADVVAQYTFIEVQKAKESKKVPAKALHICHDADLALIQPLDSSFLNDITPIKIGKMPKRRDPIFVSGYPIGGEELSTTEGVVSRVELQPYSHSLRELLAVTVDAAINSGNSGGPVFNGDGELAGIAFQALEGAANVGHIIPPPIINHFIGGFDKDGDGYQGFPELGTVVQSLENPALRKHLKLPDTKSGVLVTRLIYGNSGYGVLKEGDVILNIDGNDVNNDGSVQYNSHDRGNYQQIIHSHYVGDVIPITVWRDSTELVLQVTLEPVRELVALSQYIHRPSYYLFNGLLFQPLSTDLLRAYFSGGLMIQAPQELLYLTTVAGAPTKTRRQALVLTRVFRDDVNVGYEDLSFSVIEKVNGADVKDLADLVDKIENAQGELVELTTSQRNTIILPNKSATESTDAFKRIAKRYNVTSDRYIGDKKHHKKHHKKEDK